MMSLSCRGLFFSVQTRFNTYVSWESVFAILGIVSMVGIFTDYALHKSYTKNLKNSLVAPFVYLDDIKTIALIHADTKKVLHVLNDLFGVGKFSLRLLALSLISCVIGYLSLSAVRDHLWLDDLHNLPDYDPFFDKRAAIVTILILFVLNILTDQVSLKLSKSILERLGKSLSNLCFGLSLNILLTVILGLLPVYSAYLAFIVGFENKPFNYAVWGAGHYIKESLMAPVKFYIFPIQSYYAISRKLNVYYIPWGMFSIIAIPVTASLSSIFCGLLITRDLLLKLIIKPLCFFIASLIDNFEKEDRPVLKIFFFIGSIPLFVKALIQIYSNVQVIIK